MGDDRERTLAHLFLVQERRPPTTLRSLTTIEDKSKPTHTQAAFLKRELKARALSANRLALDLGVPSGRITDILNGRRSIAADTAVRLGRYSGEAP
jgi:antitoxin component HigA of HigAB toxin-antitoxin module